MNPNTQWAQSAQAQPYMQQARAMLGGGQQQQMGGGYGMGGGGNDYAGQLMQMIQANPQNPDLQQQLYGYYLQATDPVNQQEQQYGYLQNQLLQQQLDSSNNDTDINLALSLISSDNANDQAAGRNILASLGYMDNSQTTSLSPYDIVRNDASTQYGTVGEGGTPDVEELKWLDYLSKANDQQIQAYNDKPTYGQRWGGMSGLEKAATISSGIANPLAFLINPYTLTNKEDIRRSNAGYNF